MEWIQVPAFFIIHYKLSLSWIFRVLRNDLLSLCARKVWKADVSVRVCALPLVLTPLLLCFENPTFGSHLSSETATSWLRLLPQVCTLSARLLFCFTLYQEQEKMRSTAGIREQDWIKRFGLNSKDWGKSVRHPCPLYPGWFCRSSSNKGY